MKNRGIYLFYFRINNLTINNMKCLMNSGISFYIGTVAELEKVNEEKNIGWRGIIGRLKFDDENKNMYINQDYENISEVDMKLIELIVETQAKKNLPTDFYDELKKAIFG